MLKKTNFTTLILLLIASFMFSSITLAAAGESVLGGLQVTADKAEISQGDDGQDPAANLIALIGGAINYGFGIVAIVFMTIIAIGGYLWMAGRGNEEQIGKAKKFITNGIFGLMIIFLAYALVFVIIGAVGSATTTG